MLYPTEDDALELVIAERKEQSDKWGMQMHDNGVFSMILSEEVGELSESCLREVQGGKLTPGMLEHQIEEAIQTSAVALAWAARLMMKREQFNDKG